jgi:hypothetical protein
VLAPGINPHGPRHTVKAQGSPADLPGQPIRADHAVGVGRGEPHIVNWDLTGELQRDGKSGTPGGSHVRIRNLHETVTQAEKWLRRGRSRVGASVQNQDNPHVDMANFCVSTRTVQCGETACDVSLFVVGRHDDGDELGVAPGAYGAPPGSPVERAGQIDVDAHGERRMGPVDAEVIEGSAAGGQRGSGARLELGWASTACFG